MAACGLSGVLNVKLLKFHSDINKTKCTRLDTLSEIKCCRLETSYQKWSFIKEPVHFYAGLGKQTWRSTNPFVVGCGSSSQTNQPEDVSKEKPSIKATSHGIPNSSEVQSLLTSICDTTSIAEFKLNLGGFRLYVKRDLYDINSPPLSPNPHPTHMDTSNQIPDANGSATTTSLVISKESKPEPSVGGIKRFLDTASDEGLVILQSPKVGFFRRSRTIKGKRAPPSCKEKQEVKEGQVLCFIEQLGGEIPIESDVSGEVIRILREDGEPVGYGDALIAILPSFPGIKKLIY